MADPVRLEQILNHLVQNAIDASTPANPVTMRLGQQGMHVSVEVIDRGCGMSAEFIRSQLFKPFVSNKEGGFGIGAFEARRSEERRLVKEGGSTCRSRGGPI